MIPLHIVLHQPEIPPNTGNIIRLTANVGAQLHLVHPLGFAMQDKQLRRAGLDYHDLAHVHNHDSWSSCIEEQLGKESSGELNRKSSASAGEVSGQRIFTVSTKAALRYDQVTYQPGDVLVFGSESRGLPADVRCCVPAEQQITLPMAANNRSLNLANAVAIVVYEVWRQWQFTGAIK